MEKNETDGQRAFATHPIVPSRTQQRNDDDDRVNYGEFDTRTEIIACDCITLSSSAVRAQCDGGIATRTRHVIMN